MHFNSRVLCGRYLLVPLLITHFLVALRYAHCSADQYRNIQAGGTVNGTPFRGNVCDGGGSIGYSNGAGVAVTFTVGIDLKLELGDIWKIGLIRDSVSYTSSTSSAGTAVMNCPPGPWSCGLIVTPRVSVVSGDVLQKTKDGWKYFELTAPIVDPNNVAILGVEICTCHNLGGWAAPGHIAALCPFDC